MKSTQNKDYFSEGLKAQHTIYERMYRKCKNSPRYKIQESPEGSSKDMEDKIDITLTDTITNKEYNYDVKSSQYEDKITYTYLNSINQYSKIYNGDYSIDLIFTFKTYNDGYFVHADEFAKLLKEKIENGASIDSHVKPGSKYVWITRAEIEKINYNII